MSTADRQRIGVPWQTLHQFPWLRWALSARFEVTTLENLRVAPSVAAGWGARTAAAYARRVARLRGMPCWTLEDGFYRSVGLGKDGAASFSLVLDNEGIYFDARRASMLDRLIAGADAQDDLVGARLRRLIVARGLTKYNTAQGSADLPPARGRKRILLVDQVAGDQSLAGAGVTGRTLQAMMTDARAAQKDGAILIAKAHPDVMAGHARGVLDLASISPLWAPPDASIDALLREVDSVWTLSSQLGFDALLRGGEVVVYGAAFYAGRGLTIDRAGTLAPQVRSRLGARTPVPLDRLVGVAVGRYPIWLDPVHQHETDAETALNRLADWRDRWFTHRGRVLGIGFAWHKRRLIRQHLGAAGHAARFLRKSPATLPLDKIDEVLVWSDRLPADQVASARAAGKRVTFVEDGFIRSRGLGTTQNLASSLCFDGRALHFDARQASDLEVILETHDFSEQVLARAADLRARIVARGISKYNLAAAPMADVRTLAGRRRAVLVVAQVPGDASLRYGQPAFGSNLAFLAAVRAVRKEDFLIFKEHPDLAAGLRPGRSAVAQAARYADHIVTEGDTTQLFAHVDEVHVMTSLSGFEALLRGRHVVCHGMPFYAGWGLTEDMQECKRRTRRLTLDALVAGALLVYPRYLLPETGAPCDAEDIIARFG